MADRQDPVIPPQEAWANSPSLVTAIACALKHNMTFADINGNLPRWLASLRTAEGQRPSCEQFKEEWERQTSIPRLPDNSFEMEGK